VWRLLVKTIFETVCAGYWLDLVWELHGETYDPEYRAETAASLVRIRATATWPVVLALKFVEAE
jgi:hypothetical protein